MREPKSNKELEEMMQAYKNMPDLINKDNLILTLYEELKLWKNKFEETDRHYNNLLWKDS